MLGQAFGPDYPTWSVGVTVSYPLGRSYEEVQRRAGRASSGGRRPQRVASLQLDVAASIRQAGAPGAQHRRARGRGARRGDAGRAAARRRTAPLPASGCRRRSSSRRRSAICCRREVNLLQATLDYQSSLVSFEALQLAPASAPGARLALQGSDVVLVPPDDAAWIVPDRDERSVLKLSCRGLKNVRESGVETMDSSSDF